MQTLNLKWVIAHEPAWLFYRVAEDFKRLVNEKSSSFKIDIEILTAEEYNDLYKPEVKLGRSNLWRALRDNTVQIAQMTTTHLGNQFNRQMQVFDMPYIFDDHDHAREVLEGPIGQEILNKFDESSRLKGLAYTYSGGFRLFASCEEVASLNELVGKPMRVGLSPVASATIESLGLTPVSLEPQEFTPAVKEGKTAGGEHVAQRLIPDNCETWTKSIIDTEHSLFLTSIVVNVDWWNGLPQEVKEIFNQAAFQAARNERALSVQDHYDSLEKLKQMGAKYHKISESQRAQLKETTKIVYEKFGDNYFEPGLVDKIKK